MRLSHNNLKNKPIVSLVSLVVDVKKAFLTEDPIDLLLCKRPNERRGMRLDRKRVGGGGTSNRIIKSPLVFPEASLAGLTLQLPSGLIIPAQSARCPDDQTLTDRRLILVTTIKRHTHVDKNNHCPLCGASSF